ncbi:Na+/H+ antiporter [Silvimonas sp. JCM 19000]
MEILFTVLVLLLAVALSGVARKWLPFAVPLPLMQIAMGAVLAWPVLGLHVTFDPELFLLLFIPPLLFLDGARTPRREFVQNKRPILALALGLVFFTVAGVGYFVNWLIPEIPLPVAFALAAVLSPTDAVALGGIVGKGRIPDTLLQILEGEALMNDASGLVAFKFAVVAAMTGTFSLLDASASFVLIALGGLACGALLGVAFAWGRNVLVSFSGDEPGPQVVLMLLLPFAAYLVAERLGVSGILSAVAAGMAVNASDLFKTTSLATRLQANSTWTMIEFVFNGLVFILLGLQLPHIIGRALVEAHHDSATAAWQLVGYVLAVMLALHVLRFIWVWALRYTARAALRKQGLLHVSAGWRTLSLMTLGGVRGAVTLAGVLALPLTLPGGAPFPARDLVIFIAAAIILLSLLLGASGLPLLLRNVSAPTDTRHHREENRARAAIAHAAIAALERERDALGVDMSDTDAASITTLAAQLMEIYRRRIAVLETQAEAREHVVREERLMRNLRGVAVRAEREEAYRLHKADEINDETLSTLVREIDLAEAAFSERPRFDK